MMESVDMILCAECGEETASQGLCDHCMASPLLDERYELRELLGAGASGRTYRARRLSDGQEVAVKELSIRRIESMKALELFEREAAVLKSLEHKGIPRYLEDFSKTRGRQVHLYLVQELIQGENLEVQRKRRPFEEEEVVRILDQTLEILEYLQGLTPPVVHRDIKPSNLMKRAGDGSLVLIDFGSVQEVRGAEKSGSTVAGTYGYMAPEQFAGMTSVAADIYALGATALALVSGRDIDEFLTVEHRLEWRGKFAISKELEEFLAAMLQEDYQSRPTDIAALRERLSRILDGMKPELVERKRRRKALLQRVLLYSLPITIWPIIALIMQPMIARDQRVSKRAERERKVEEIGTRLLQGCLNGNSAYCQEYMKVNHPGEDPRELLPGGDLGQREWQAVYTAACQRGDMEACRGLADQYEAAGHPRAATYMEEVCDWGDQEYCLKFAEQLGEESLRARTLLQQSCEAGVHEACSQLGKK